jgi:hypothetical protein
MTDFVDSRMLQPVGAGNILAPLVDGSARGWRVKAIANADGTNVTTFKPNSLEIERTLPNGAILMVHRDGLCRLDTRSAVWSGALTTTVRVIAEADDGAALYTSYEGVVIERGPGAEYYWTQTIALAEPVFAWSPASLSPAFWLRPDQPATRVLADATPAGTATSGHRTWDASRRAVTVSGMTDAQGGPRALTQAVAPSYQLSSQGNNTETTAPYVDLTTESLHVRGNRMNFDAPVSGRTVLCLMMGVRSAGLEGKTLLEGPAAITKLFPSGFTWSLAGATGAVRVNGRPAADVPCLALGWTLLSVELDAAVDWTAIASSRYGIRDLIILPGAITAADRQRWEGWAAHRWQCQHLLPHDHPYRWTPPGAAAPAVEPTPTPAAVSFARRTLAGCGGVPVRYLTAPTITAGNAVGHWQLLHGRLCPTAAFAAANVAAGASYTLTIGGLAVTVTITDDGGRPTYTVSDTADLIRTFDAIRTGSVVDATVECRDGLYAGFASYDFQNAAVGTLRVTAGRLGRVQFPMFYTAGLDAPHQLDVRRIEGHFPYFRARDEDSGSAKPLNIDGIARNVVSRGYYLDWSKWAATGWQTLGFRVYGGIYAKELYYSEVYNADAVGGAPTCVGSLFANALGDGPVGLVFAVDNLRRDNPYVGATADEGGKHSDMKGQVQKDPYANIQRSWSVMSPILVLNYPTQEHRGLFFESSSLKDNPAQQYGAIWGCGVVGKSDQAAFSLNEKALAGMVIGQNVVSTQLGAAIKSGQGGRNIAGIANPNSPQNFQLTALNFADAFDSTPLPTDRPVTRADILAFLRPRAGGPLDLGGGEVIGPVRLDGTPIPLTDRIGPAHPPIPSIAQGTDGFTIAFSNPAFLGRPGATITGARVCYMRLPAGADSTLRTREDYSLARNVWEWEFGAQEQDWTLVDQGVSSGMTVNAPGSASYYAAVQLRNSDGLWSPWSPNSNLLALGAGNPVVEGKPTLVPASGGFTVSWGAAAGATLYDIQHSPAGAATWTTVAGVAGTSATLTGLAGLTAYDVRVRAQGGPWSQFATETTLAAGELIASLALSQTFPPGTAVTSYQWDTTADALEGQTILIPIYWYNTTARSVSSVSVSNGADGSGSRACTAIAAHSSINTNGGASNARVQLWAVTLPAGASLTDIRVNVTFSGSCRATLAGGVAVLAAAANEADITIATEAALAAPGSATITTKAGALLLFGAFQSASSSADPTAVNVSANLSAFAQWDRINGQDSVHVIAGRTLSGALSPASQAVTVDLDPDYIVTAAFRTSGVIAVMVGAP